MALEIKKPDELRKAKVLIFAPAGAGKTTFLGTAEEDERTSPMLFLDFEGGHESLAGLDIDVAEIRAWEDYNEAFEVLADPDTKYKSVGIDTLSETHIFALLNRLDDKAAERKEPDLIEQGDYGIASTQMRRFMREFRDLPMHVFFSAHSKEVEMTRVGKVTVPALSGQMAEEAVNLVSVAGYLAQAPGEEEGQVDRILLMQNYPKFRTKARMPWGKPPVDELENPTVTSLLDILGFPPAGSNGRPRSRKKSEDA